MKLEDIISDYGNTSIYNVNVNPGGNPVFWNQLGPSTRKYDITDMTVRIAQVEPYKDEFGGHTKVVSGTQVELYDTNPTVSFLLTRALDMLSANGKHSQIIDRYFNCEFIGVALASRLQAETSDEFQRGIMFVVSETFPQSMKELMEMWKRAVWYDVNDVWPAWHPSRGKNAGKVIVDKRPVTVLPTYNNNSIYQFFNASERFKDGEPLFVQETFLDGVEDEEDDVHSYLVHYKTRSKHINTSMV